MLCDKWWNDVSYVEVSCFIELREIEWIKIKEMKENKVKIKNI